MIHRNKFFRLHQENQSKPRDRLVTVAKGFLKLPNLHMLIKQEFITSQKLGSRDFLQIDQSGISRGKSAIPPPFSGLEVLSCAFDKA